jgi:hypothetical protein
MYLSKNKDWLEYNFFKEIYRNVLKIKPVVCSKA